MASLQSIAMPKLGLTMTEGVLTEWRVRPGDRVSAGDVIFIVETDKISNEIEAQLDGVVAELHASPGEALPVGAALLSLRVDGDASVGVAGAQSGPQNDPGPAKRIIATPLARRMAVRSGIDLARVAGSGPRGRIMAEDVAGAATTLKPPAHANDIPPRTSPVVDSVSPHGHLHEPRAYQRVAAQRLTEAKRDIPHFYVFAEADVTDLLALREQLNGSSGGGPRLTVNSFLIAALARTLAAMPAMNRVWSGDGLLELPTVDIGMAVEGPHGLIAPVLRELGSLTLDEVAMAADALITRARTGRLALQDLEGGAAAISNVGMFGVSGLLPIINPGQSSILGVGANQPRFRPDAHGRPALRQMLKLALSCDHRVIDGALAARFLQALCRQLETSAVLLRRPQEDHDHEF